MDPLHTQAHGALSIAWCWGPWTPHKLWTAQSCRHCADVRAERQPCAFHSCVSWLVGLVFLFPACRSVLLAVAREWGEQRSLSEASLLHICALWWIQGHSGSHWQLGKTLHWLRSVLDLSIQHPFEILYFSNLGNWPAVQSWRCWELSRPSQCYASQTHSSKAASQSIVCSIRMYLDMFIWIRELIVLNGSPGMPCQNKTKTLGVCWTCRVSKKFL